MARASAPSFRRLSVEAGDKITGVTATLGPDAKLHVEHQHLVPTTGRGVSLPPPRDVDVSQAELRALGDFFASPAVVAALRDRKSCVDVYDGGNRLTVELDALTVDVNLFGCVGPVYDAIRAHLVDLVRAHAPTEARLVASLEASWPPDRSPR